MEQEGVMEKSEMMKKKAYHVRINNDEGYCTVVFAENRNKARLLAMGDDNFDSNYMKYTDIHPIRMPQADFFTEKYPDLCRLNIDNPEHAKFLRDEGWWNINCSYCEECGLATFEAVPESQLEYVDGMNICLECLKEREVKNGKE